MLSWRKVDRAVLVIVLVDALAHGHFHGLLDFELVEVLQDEEDEAGEDDDHDGHDDQDDCQNTVDLLLLGLVTTFGIDDHQFWSLRLELLNQSDVASLADFVLRFVRLLSLLLLY
jgi:hypothetical protein